MLCSLRFAGGSREGGPAARLDPGIDVDDLFRTSLAFKLVSCVARAYADDPRIADSRSPFALYLRLARELLDVQLADTRRAAEVLDGAGVPFLVFKGIDLYGHPHAPPPRIMADVDFLIRREDVETVRALIPSIGFEQLPGVDVVRQIEHDHYEMAPFSSVRSLDLAPELVRLVHEHGLWILEVAGKRRRGRALEWKFELDFHHDLLEVTQRSANRGISVKEVWRAPTSVSLGDGVEIRALRPPLLLWLLCMRCYVESLAGDSDATRMLGDALVLLHCHRIDFDDLARLCTKTRSSRMVYLVLRFLADFCGAPIPQSTLGDLRRDVRGATSGVVTQRSPDGRTSAVTTTWGDILPLLVGRSTQDAPDSLAIYDLVPDDRLPSPAAPARAGTGSGRRLRLRRRP